MRWWRADAAAAPNAQVMTPMGIDFMESVV
jgi:hypothetical protein